MYAIAGFDKGNLCIFMRTSTRPNRAMAQSYRIEQFPLFGIEYKEAETIGGRLIPTEYSIIGTYMKPYERLYTKTYPLSDIVACENTFTGLIKMADAVLEAFTTTIQQNENYRYCLRSIQAEARAGIDYSRNIFIKLDNTDIEFYMTSSEDGLSVSSLVISDMDYELTKFTQLVERVLRSLPRYFYGWQHFV